MTVETLKTKQDNSEARAILVQRKTSFIASKPKSSLYKKWLSLLHKEDILIGEFNKSWDVLRTVQFIETHLSSQNNILDIGAYASEVLCVLYLLKFKNLFGIDLNPQVVNMPYSRRISYQVSDFMKTNFEDSRFSAITAISVIEHGLDIEKLLKEISRLLKSGGYFIGSTDYWDEKINTEGIQIFNMDWQIFSSNELTNFFDIAAKYGLYLYGNCDLSVQDRVISCLGKDYTFAWFVLQKK